MEYVGTSSVRRALMVRTLCTAQGTSFAVVVSCIRHEQPTGTFIVEGSASPLYITCTQSYSSTHSKMKLWWCRRQHPCVSWCCSQIFSGCSSHLRCLIRRGIRSGLSSITTFMGHMVLFITSDRNEVLVSLGLASANSAVAASTQSTTKVLYMIGMKRALFGNFNLRIVRHLLSCVYMVFKEALPRYRDRRAVSVGRGTASAICFRSLAKADVSSVLTFRIVVSEFRGFLEHCVFTNETWYTSNRVVKSHVCFGQILFDKQTKIINIKTSVYI